MVPWGWWGLGATIQGHGGFLDEGMILVWIVVMVACLYTITQTYQTVHFQGVDYTIGK